MSLFYDGLVLAYCGGRGHVCSLGDIFVMVMAGWIVIEAAALGAVSIC